MQTLHDQLFFSEVNHLNEGITYLSMSVITSIHQSLSGKETEIGHLLNSLNKEGGLSSFSDGTISLSINVKIDSPEQYERILSLVRRILLFSDRLVEIISCETPKGSVRLAFVDMGGKA